MLNTYVLFDKFRTKSAVTLYMTYRSIRTIAKGTGWALNITEGRDHKPATLQSHWAEENIRHNVEKYWIKTWTGLFK
jgi:hypothetical protein